MASVSITELLRVNSWNARVKKQCFSANAMKQNVSILKYILFIKFFDNCPTLRTRQILSQPFLDTTQMEDVTTRLQDVGILFQQLSADRTFIRFYPVFIIIVSVIVLIVIVAHVNFIVAQTDTEKIGSLEFLSNHLSELRYCDVLQLDRGENLFDSLVNIQQREVWKVFPHHFGERRDSALQSWIQINRFRLLQFDLSCFITILDRGGDETGRRAAGRGGGRRDG